jgi:hypothetical protein
LNFQTKNGGKSVPLSASLEDRRPTPVHLYLATHPVLEIARSLLFSAALWVLLAVGLYAVYSIIAG